MKSGSDGLSCPTDRNCSFLGSVVPSGLSVSAVPSPSSTACGSPNVTCSFSGLDVLGCHFDPHDPSRLHFAKLHSFALRHLLSPPFARESLPSLRLRLAVPSRTRRIAPIRIPLEAPSAQVLQAGAFPNGCSPSLYISKFPEALRLVRYSSAVSNVPPLLVLAKFDEDEEEKDIPM